MSDEQLPYSPCYIKAWSILSAVVAACLLAGFFLCKHLLNAGDWIWYYIRLFFSPII